MKKRYIKEEEKVILGKKVKIKTLPNPLTAQAFKGNTIEVSENIKGVLGEEGYKQILLHERGHLRFINNFLLSLPSILFLSSILFFLFNMPDFLNHKLLIFYFWFMPSLFILEILCFWSIEILADKFAIKNSNNPKTYEKTLNKIYDYPGYAGNNSWVYRNIKHPPKKIRFYFINKFVKGFGK